MALAYYDAQRGRYAYLWDSYWGGERYRCPSSTTIGTTRLTRYVPRRDAQGREVSDEYDEVDVATYRTYLVPHPGESRREFELRLALAAYVNFPRIIVESYVEAVVGPAVHDLGDLGQYLSNLNGRGRTWADHVEDVARWVQVYGWTATLLDAPATNPATNAAEEERLGVGLRAVHVHPSAIAWLDVSRDGQVLEFAFVDAPYQPEAVAPGGWIARVYVYGLAGWAAYDVPLRSGDALSVARAKIYSADAPLPPSAVGPALLPGRVPVVFAFATEDTSSAVPLGQSSIDDAADHARQVYNTLSWIEEIHRKTAFPFLAIPEPAAGGELDPRTRVQVGPSSALGYGAGTGAPSWVQPSAESTAELRTHALFLVMLAVRLAGLEVSLDAGSGNESGVAIELRNRKFNSTCKRLAKNLAAYEQQVFDMARAALGRPAAAASTTYPKRFVLPSPSEDLRRIVDFVTAFGGDLSLEARQECIRQASEAALRVSDEQLAALMDTVRAKAEEGAGTAAEIYAYDHDAGIIQVNEARALKGLPPIAGGEVSTLEWATRINARVAAEFAPKPPAPTPEG